MSLPAYASGSDKRDGLSYQEQDLEYCHLSAKEKNVKGIWLVAVIIHSNSTWKTMIQLFLEMIKEDAVILFPPTQDNVW